MPNNRFLLIFVHNFRIKEELFAFLRSDEPRVSHCFAQKSLLLLLLLGGGE